MSRYCVVIATDEYHRVFGTFQDKERAEALAEKINAAVEKRLDRDTAEWEKRYAAGEVSYSYGSPADMRPEGHDYGRAGVLMVRQPRVREAIAYALGQR